MPPVIAYHIDLRCSTWTRAYLATIADRLQAWGYNTLLYELEDKFPYARHPAIARADAPSREEHADFAARCRAQGMEIIPLVQSLAHSEYILAKPEYAHLREQAEVKDQYDPLSPAVLSFLIELFDEVIDVFGPREFFHMGGDESWTLGTSANCTERVAAIGVGGLYLQHMLPLFNHLGTRGLRPIIWADMAVTHPAMLRQMPREVVMMDWDYATRNSTPRTVNIYGTNPATGRGYGDMSWDGYCALEMREFRAFFEPYLIDAQTRREGTFHPFFYTDALRGHGFDVMTASSCRCLGDMPGIPNYSMHLPNCFHSARKGLYDGLGNTVTSWAVRRVHPEVTMLAVYAAAYARQHALPFDAAMIGRAFCRDFYGVDRPDFISLVYLAQQGLSFCRQYVQQEMLEIFARGEDPLPAAIALHLERYNDQASLLRTIDSLHEGYQWSRDKFGGLQQQAVRHAANLDYWLEALDLQLFYLDFLRAAVRGELPGQRKPMLARLDALKTRTADLFAATYTRDSLEAELTARYGFIEGYLTGMAGVGE